MCIRDSLFGDVLARALYQPLAQVGGELRPGIGGDVDAASQRAADVYKRQIQVYLWLPVSDMFSTILAKIQVLMLQNDIERMQAAVSYTHLDVYKRQQ